MLNHELEKMRMEHHYKMKKMELEHQYKLDMIKLGLKYDTGREISTMYGGIEI